MKLQLLAALIVVVGFYVDTCESVVTFTVASTCRSQRTCQSCISAHHECVWCSDDNSTTSSVFKCSIASETMCDPKHIANPRTVAVNTGNADFTSTPSADKPAIQLKPQKIDLKLRPGEAVTLDVVFKKTIEYPLDLYYVMDLSNSMKDDLEKLQELGDNLIGDIKKYVTSNVKLGFGSFVDKVMMPYASTVEEHLKDPCDGENTCAPVFGFKHQLKITDDAKKFKDVVSATIISGNIDSPEGGFDALMQIAACQEDIGWRGDALRMVLYASDASPHVALDGKLAAILEANDETCHLQKGINKYLPEDVVYSKSKELDYPSAGQLKTMFQKQKITTIFAVTQEVQDIYMDLQKALGSTAITRLLESDSRNVVSVISEAYEDLKSRMSLSVQSPPDNVEMSYKVKCPNETKFTDNLLECSNVGNIGDQVTFKFTLNAKSCPKDPKQVDKIVINSGQLVDETEITISYQCSCDCSESRVEMSDLCSKKGDYECGTCRCNEGYTGRKCQCKIGSGATTIDEKCKKTSDAKSLCSGHGFCECGDCMCYNDHFGDFCQCLSTGCPSNEDGICGGKDQGDCKNCDSDRQCVCKNGYTLSKKTNVCTCNKLSCKKDRKETNAICSDNGVCDCDSCKCNTYEGQPLFQGSYCEECIHPNCKDRKGTCIDEDFYFCAQCVYDSLRVSKSPEIECVKECSNKSISFKSYDLLPDCSSDCENTVYTEDCKTCKTISTDYSSKQCKRDVQELACKVTYKVVWDTQVKDYILQVQKFDKEADCEKAIDPLMIVFPVVGGILLIGFILLVAWKVFTHFRDKVEYETFLEDQKQSRWTQGENPLFSKASVRVENPAFIGK